MVGPRADRAKLAQGYQVGLPAGGPSRKPRIAALKPTRMVVLDAATDLTHVREAVERGDCGDYEGSGLMKGAPGEDGFKAKCG